VTRKIIAAVTERWPSIFDSDPLPA
jgi:hypothetical protein